MRYFRLYFLVSLLFYCCSFASAQQWIVYRDTNSALPTNWLAKIKIDKFDNKWMLSYNANDLIKFDGSTWTIYNHSNSGLPDTNLLSISIDKNDNKWIATKNGLVKFDNSNWTIYNTSNSCLPINQINDCDVDSSNNVWLATDLGIIKFDTSLNCALYNSANGALAGMNSTREIKIDSRNWVWSISAAAMPWWYLNSFDGITWHNYSPVNYGNNVSLSNFTLFCDSVGNVWSSSGMGILKYDGSIFSVPFDTSISVKFMSTGAVYANSNFIASAGLTFESLNYYSGGVWTITPFLTHLFYMDI